MSSPWIKASELLLLNMNVAIKTSQRPQSIFTYMYHQQSTIHVGKYTIFPWILWEKKTVNFPAGKNPLQPRRVKSTVLGVENPLVFLVALVKTQGQPLVGRKSHVVF